MSLKTRTKDLLLVLHRYLGLAGCVMFVIWFSSGLVMMYVDMPYLERSDERLVGLEPLSSDTAMIGPNEALRAAASGGAPKRLFLNMQQGQPVWRIVPSQGLVVSVDAQTGQVLPAWPAEEARRAALDWGGWDGEVVFEDTVEMDQWTVYGDLFDRYRPLHRFRVDGPSGTRVHVSQATGMVVQVTSRRERLLACLGPVAHWIYPTFIRRNVDLWGDLVIWISGLGTLMVSAGLVLGVWNLRRPSSKGGLSPYKRRWMRWHHLFGLVFGLVTLSWISSGMMSMSPFDWAPSTDPTPTESAHFAGADRVDWSDFVRGPASAVSTFSSELSVKELEARFFGGRPFWVARESPTRSLVLAAHENDDEATARPSSELPEPALREATLGLVEGATIDEWTRLEDYDNFYYSKKRFKDRKRLPVYRAVFDDADRTSFYIDPHEGSIVLRMEPRSRLNRYLYHGLHSWDVQNFFNKRPWWDLTVGFFMLGGTFLALTSLILGVQWSSRQKP